MQSSKIASQEWDEHIRDYFSNILLNFEQIERKANSCLKPDDFQEFTQIYNRRYQHCLTVFGRIDVDLAPELRAGVEASVGEYYTLVSKIGCIEENVRRLMRLVSDYPYKWEMVS